MISMGYTNYYLSLIFLWSVSTSSSPIPKSLRGKVACVTGASRGIGKGVAIGLAEAGATVYITGRSSGNDVTEKLLGGNLEDVISEIESVGSEGIMIRCDHKDDDQVRRVFEEIDRRHGRLDILVNNAFQTPSPPDGAEDPYLLFKKFWEQPGWFWDSFMNIGLRSHYMSSHYAFPLLKKTMTNTNESPLIVHISSFGGVSYSFNVAYGVGKAGVDRMARDMAYELLPHDINCVSLYPGVVQTERMKTVLGSGLWRNKTNLATPMICTETPRLTGRVISTLYSNLLSKQIKREEYNGKVGVVAELAKKFGVTDMDGNLPPSIRSLRFLIPSVLFAQFPTPPSKELEELVVRLCPDVLLPMSFMSGGPPSSPPPASSVT